MNPRTPPSGASILEFRVKRYMPFVTTILISSSQKEKLIFTIRPSTVATSLDNMAVFNQAFLGLV